MSLVRSQSRQLFTAARLQRCYGINNQQVRVLPRAYICWMGTSLHLAASRHCSGNWRLSNALPESVGELSGA